MKVVSESSYDRAAAEFEKTHNRPARVGTGRIGAAREQSSEDLTRSRQAAVAGERASRDARFKAAAVFKPTVSQAGRSFLREFKAVIAQATAPVDQGGYTTRARICEKMGIKLDRLDRWCSESTEMFPTAIDLYELVTNDCLLRKVHRHRLIAYLAGHGGMIATEPGATDRKPLEVQACEALGELGAVARLLATCRARESAGGQALTKEEKQLLMTVAREAIRETQEFVVAVGMSEEKVTEFKQCRTPANERAFALFDFLFVMCILILFTGAAVLYGPWVAAGCFAVMTGIVFVIARGARGLSTLLDGMTEAGAINLDRGSGFRL